MGLSSDASTTNGITITANSIAYNTQGGSRSVTGSVSMKGNYWGDVTGPYDPSDDRATGGWYNPGGLGNRVSDKIDYTGWLSYDPNSRIQTSFSGVVSNAQTSQPVMGALVRLGVFGAYTDATGYYHIDGLSNAAYPLSVTRIGYANYNGGSVNPALTPGRNIALTPDPASCPSQSVALDGVVRDELTKLVKSGVSVTLSGVGATLTNASGAYHFSGVAAGTHTLSATPAGYFAYYQKLYFCGNQNWTVSLTTTSTTLGQKSAAPYSDDPVNTATGNYTYAHVDMKLPGKGLPFIFERSYNSQDIQDGPLGFGWTHNWNARASLDAASGAVTVRWGDGRTETWASDGAGGFTSQYGVFDTLLTNGDGTYSVKKKDLTVWRFNTGKQLALVTDRNGNGITLNYSGAVLAQIIDAAGRAMNLAHDANNRITSITDPLGRIVSFAYDPAGNLVSALDRNSQATLYSYDADHQMLSATDPRGNVFVTNVYDNAKRVVTSQRDAKAGQTTFVYNPANRQTTLTSALGNVTVHHYDEFLRMVRVDDARGYSELYHYDIGGSRDQVADRNANITLYEYDAKGNVTRKTDPVGQVTSITYDANNNPLTRTDALNNTASFIYDAVGNLTRTTDALNNTASVTYDASGLPLTITDARGNVTTNTYDVQGNPIQVTNALANVTTFTYDGVGRKISKKDALNRITTYAYDNNDNPLSATDPLGKTIISTYDGNNNRLTSTDKRGNITSFAYDVKDLPVSVTDALSGVMTTTYNALDRKIATKDKRNNATTFAYDGVGNSIQVTDALSNATKFTYDGNGNRLTATDPLNHTSSAVYDALNRQRSATDALTNASTTIYDALSRVTSTTNAKGQVTSFTYDKLGRLVQVTDANSGTVKYAYDQSGNRISMTDPNGHVTTYAYDALNRMVTKTESLGGVTAYQYDAVGNQVQVTQPNGTAIHYAYDALDRLGNVTYPDLSTVSLTYDANGNRTGMTDSLGASSYQYDALNRVTSATDPFGKTVSYGYDANGNRITLTYPGAKVVTYGYDVLNRLGTVSDWLAHTTTYTYDAASRLSASANPNGTAASYSFDNANRLTGLSNTKGATVFASYAYALDAIGNHTQVTQNEPLPPVFTPGTVAYSYDADNRLNSVGSTVNNFDANGNMTAKGTNTFAYDFENRLKQSTIGGVATQYGYNGGGNRLSRIIGSTTTRYVLDLNGSLSQVLAETDGSGTVSAYYVYGLGLISRIQPNGSASYYHYDSRGSTVALTDMSGAVTDKYAYDAFGKIVNSQGTTPNSFKYLGQYGVMDEGNGLHYVRARYYDADAGRFISKDPKAGNDKDGQSLNRYAYAENNPVRFVDVSGFSPKEVSGLQQILGKSTDTSNFHNALIGQASMRVTNSTIPFLGIGNNYSQPRLAQSSLGVAHIDEGLVAIYVGATLPSTVAGASVFMGGLAACGGTFGAACIAGVPAMAWGAAMAAPGALMVLGGTAEVIVGSSEFISGLVGHENPLKDTLVDRFNELVGEGMRGNGL